MRVMGLRRMCAVGRRRDGLGSRGELGGQGGLVRLQDMIRVWLILSLSHTTGTPLPLLGSARARHGPAAWLDGWSAPGSAAGAGVSACTLSQMFIKT